jgi:hypothetical protein
LILLVYPQTGAAKNENLSVNVKGLNRQKGNLEGARGKGNAAGRRITRGTHVATVTVT